MTAKPLTLQQIQPGDALPELAVDVNPTTVVLGALASRDSFPCGLLSVLGWASSYRMI